jgi:DNA-binding XRE family transcriptional regulator
MRHIEEVTITIKGLTAKPEIYTVPKKVGRELVSYIEEIYNEDSIPAHVVIPELADDIKRPAIVLRGLRYREHLTQKQLAEKLSIHQHHLSEMENGKRPIGKEMAKKLADILHANWKIFL